MPLIVLGLIVIVAAGLLVYNSTARRAPSERPGPRVREHKYEKSEDGKVVFLYKNNDGSGSSDGDSGDSHDGGNDAGGSDDAGGPDGR